MKKKNNISRMLAAVAAGIFCLSALPVIVCGLPFDGESDRLKFVSAETDGWAIELKCGNASRTFRIGSDESNLRGMPDTRPETVREYLELIAYRQGFGETAAVGCVLPRALFEMESWIQTQEIAPIDAKIEPKGRGFGVAADRDGMRVDRTAFYRSLYSAARAGGGSVALLRLPDRAAFTAAKAAEEIRYRASFTTSIATSSIARKTNVALALANFDGMSIQPGESVSFNKVVGPRTQERGYQTAKIILNGKYEDGVGGGVCQASSTLYNALVLAGVTVDRVTHHTLAPSYVPPSRDAMVNSVGADLAFTNTTGRGVHLRVFATQNDVSVFVYGVGMKERLSIESETIETIPEPAPSVREDDGTYARYVVYDDEIITVKSGHEGQKTRAWLVSETAQGVKRKLLRTDTYAPLKGEAVRGKIPASQRPSAAIPQTPAHPSPLNPIF